MTESSDDLVSAISALGAAWQARLGMSEHIEYDVFIDDGKGDSDLRGRCVPNETRSDGNLWDFRIDVERSLPPAERERVVVHELVHVLMEPLRVHYFTLVVPSDEGVVERWETVIERIADILLTRPRWPLGIITQRLWPHEEGVALGPIKVMEAGTVGPSE